MSATATRRTKTTAKSATKSSGKSNGGAPKSNWKSKPKFFCVGLNFNEETNRVEERVITDHTDWSYANNESYKLRHEAGMDMVMVYAAFPMIWRGDQGEKGEMAITQESLDVFAELLENEKEEAEDEEE